MGKGKKGGKKGGKGSKKAEKAPAHGHGWYQERIDKAEAIVQELDDILDERDLKEEEVRHLYEQIESDKSDITSYINRMIREQEICIGQLNEKREELIDHTVTDNLRSQLRTDEKEITEVMRVKEHEKTKIKGKLNDMAEISSEKRKIENQIANHKQQLIDEDEEFKELLYLTEKDSLKARDQKKAEMIRRVKQLTTEFKKLSNAQVSETSKQAIRTNHTLWENLNRLDAYARRSIDNNKAQKSELQQATLEAKVMEHIEESADTVTGTLPAFRKENARKAQIIQELVVNYRDIEGRIRNLEGRGDDLCDIDDQISEIKESKQVQALEEKINFLESTIQAAQSDVEHFNKECASKMQESTKLAALARLIISDLEDQGGLESATAQMIIKTVGNDITTERAKSMKSHYTMGDAQFVPP